MFMVFYIITGSGFFSYLSISCILFNEISSNKFGVYGNIFFLSFWAIAQVIIVVSMQVLQNWRLIFLCVIGIPSFCYLGAFIFIYESPRYELLIKIFFIFSPTLFFLVIYLFKIKKVFI